MSQAGSFASAIIPPGAGILTITGDFGGAIGPDLVGNVNLFGAHGINTHTAGHTATVAINNTITLGDIVVIGPGLDSLTLASGDITIDLGNINVISGDINLPTTTAAIHGVINVNAVRFIHTYGINNTFLGISSGNFALTANDCTAVGTSTLQNVTSGNANTAIGFGTLASVTTGDFNVGVGDNNQGVIITSIKNTSIGSGALSLAVDPSNSNVAVGFNAIYRATNPTNNIAIGADSGSAYLTNESNNILLGNTGVVGDSAKTRIGTHGTQTATFVAGVDGVNVGSTAKIVTLGTGGTADQLGTATLTAGANVVITPGANTITIAAVGGGAGLLTLTGDAGGAVPGDLAANINIPGSHGISTAGVIGTNTVGISINNSIVLGDLAAIPAATDALTCTTGDITITHANFNIPFTISANVGVIKTGGAPFIHQYSALGFTNFFAGRGAGNFTTTAEFLTGVGLNCLQSVTTGNGNVAVGCSALSDVTTGTYNVAVGYASQSVLLTGVENTSVGNFTLQVAGTTSGTNTAIGFSALGFATNPTNNIAIGAQAGSNYTTTESNNICIGSNGVIGDAGVTRIGTNGTQTSAFITGIDGVNVGNTAKVVTLGTGATADQLGTATITGGTGITITPGVNTITIAATGGATGVATITGNTGGAISPTAGNINVVTANSTVKFVGSGSTETLDFSLTNLVLGTALPSITTATNNVGLGYGVLNATTSGSQNVALGYNSLRSVTTGGHNTAVGYSAGSAYTTNETNNICIGYNVTGTATESNTIRLGNASHTACYVTGIDGVNVGSVATVVTEASGQLGTATLTAGTNITIVPTANTITINASGTGGGSIKTTVFNADGVWTKDPAAKYIFVCLWGGGAGGSSGSTVVNSLSTYEGGWGGPVGDVQQREGPAINFPATAVVTIGTGGLGAHGSPAGTGTILGGLGGTTYFGALSATGSVSIGNFNGSFVTQYSKYPLPNSFSRPGYGGGTGSSPFIGGNGGSAYITFCAGSGGGGGGAFRASSARIDPYDGGAGTYGTSTGGQQPYSPDGTDGADWTEIINFTYTGGDGGGGGASGEYNTIVRPIISNDPGKGGNGGWPGGGGGGGGGGTVAGGSSGAGGDGADGGVLVIEYL